MYLRTLFGKAKQSLVRFYIRVKFVLPNVEPVNSANNHFTWGFKDIAKNQRCFGFFSPRLKLSALKTIENIKSIKKKKNHQSLRKNVSKRLVYIKKEKKKSLQKKSTATRSAERLNGVVFPAPPGFRKKLETVSEVENREQTEPRLF